MQYTISKVGFFSTETYGKDSNHRVMVSLEGEDRDYSAFVAAKPNIGDVWDGTLEKSEKGDKIYWNFKFAGKSTKSNSGISEDQYRALMRSIEAVNANVLRVLSLVDTKTSDGGNGPDF